MSYKGELTRAMSMLALDPRTLFLGQSVRYGGQAMFSSFSGVPIERRIEMPVCEDMQMGICTGLALEGFVPISIYPRIDFLLLAANQLVNHLDKWWAMSKVRAKVIIRTAVGGTFPLNPGPQHIQDHTEAFRLMLKNVLVFDLHDEEDIVASYSMAMRHQGPVLLIEYRDQYDRSS